MKVRELSSPVPFTLNKHSGNQTLLTALRLYPPVPINMRIATKTTYLPRGGLPDGNSPVLVRRGRRHTSVLI